MDFPRSISFCVRIAVPVAAIVISGWLTSLLFVSGHEMDMYRVDSLEAILRWLCCAAVFSICAFLSILAAFFIFGRRFRNFVLRNAARTSDTIWIAALVAISATFSAFDMSFNVGDSTAFTALALSLGFLSSCATFLSRDGKLRRRLLAIAIFCVFCWWITFQKHIDWNMKRPFLRFYSRIETGMTRDQVEAILREEFPARRPVVRIDDGGMHLRLDPNDGRFNSEVIMIQMVDGHVNWKHYSPD
jgi:hypothetical protein